MENVEFEEDLNKPACVLYMEVKLGRPKLSYHTPDINVFLLVSRGVGQFKKTTKQKTTPVPALSRQNRFTNNCTSVHTSR